MEYFDPRSIEKQSLAIIRAHLAGWNTSSPQELSVIERVIHATADLAYRDLLVFSHDAVPRGIQALREGYRIITDVHMVATGINKRLCKALQVEVRCYLRAPGEGKGEEEGLTRSMVAMKRAVEEEGDGIYVVGNAPTALFTLLECMEQGMVAPKLVVGVPVGFVGASEAKASLRRFSVASITTRGPKGGTPVAVAIMNALLAMAVGGEYG